MNSAHYRKCWTREAIDRYFTSEAMSKTREAFNEVHIPIDRISVDPQYPAARGHREVSEDQLLAIMTTSRPTQPNRIFLVVGDTGSGKSELCQWLNYNIHNEIHVPILIERRMIRLGDIVEEIHRHLGQPVPSDMIEITDLWPETVSAKLRAAALMHLQQAQVQNALGAYNIEKLRRMLDTPDFEQRMRYHFERYLEELEHLERSRQLQLLPEADFRDLAIKAGGVRDPNRCYLHIQRSMTDCLARELKVEDLVQKLGRLSEAFRKASRRPVLLIEDITTFGFLQNDLLDYLYNLSGGNYDVVMGVTTGFEQDNQEQIYKTQQTITERIEGRFELTDQHNETLFLREHYVNLAHRYLDAIRNSECDDCCEKANCGEAFGDGLYPFNKPFLAKIYQNLRQAGNRKQTPRLFLRAIQNVLESDLPPYQSIELSPNVDNPGSNFAQYSQLGRETEELLKWYGQDSTKGVFLSSAVADAFGVKVPPQIEQVSGHHRFELRPGVERYLPEPPATLDLTTAGSVGADALISVSISPQQDQKTSLPEQPLPPNVFAQLDEWLAHEGQFPDRATFKDGIYRLLDLYKFEPFVIRHPDSIAAGGTPITFERGEKHAKLYLHHSADDRPYHKLIIEPDRAKRDQFSQVLAIGTGDYEPTDAERIDHAAIYDWLHSLVDSLDQEMLEALHQSLRISLDTFIVFTKFLLLNITTTIYVPQAETLVQPIKDEPLALPGMGEQAKRLWANRDHINALFVALFHYRDNLVNYPMLEQTASSMDLLHLLQEVSNIDTDTISTGFRTKVGDFEIQFKDLVKLVKSYAAYLYHRVRSQNYHLTPSKDELLQILWLCSPRDAVESTSLQAQVDALRQMAHANNIRWLTQWDLGFTPLHQSPGALDFTQLHDDLSDLIDLIASMSGEMTIFAYLALQRRVEIVVRRPEYEVLSAIEQMRKPFEAACESRRSTGHSQTIKSFAEFRRVCRELQGAVNP